MERKNINNKMVVKRILVKGYYGYGNFGDDIFCFVFAKWLEKNMGNIQPIFIGKNFPSNIPFIKVKSNFSRRFIELYYLIRSDKVVYFGGTVFHSKIKNFDLRKIILLSDKLKKKTNVFGISIGPFPNYKIETENIKFLESINEVFVRDVRSLQFLQNSRYSFDPAIYIGELFPKLLNRNDRNIIGLNIGNFATSSDSITEMADFVKYILEENPDICIQLFILNKDDTKNTQILFDLISTYTQNINIKKYSDDLEYFFEELSRCSFVIGERLHFGITAFALNIPFKQITYHQKCKDFLEDIHYPYQNINIKEIYLNKEKLIEMNEKNRKIKLKILNDTLQKLGVIIDG